MSRARRIRGFPVDLATIARDVGSLLLIQALMMAVTTVVAVAFREWWLAVAFLVSTLLTGGVGAAARRGFADAPPPKMKHGMVIAAGGWFTTALFGTAPFLLAAYLTPPAVMATFVPAGADWEPVRVLGVTSRSSLVYFRNPLHALFESMSGWTGSGLTMAVHEPSLPRTLQWWRSFIQWVGGVGVIVLTVSILARPGTGAGSYALYQSEAREEKIHPSVISTVRTVWKIFVGYTLLAIVLLFLSIHFSEYGAGLPLFEEVWQAINHAMTGLATGGFSVTDNSIGTYNSPLVETVLLPIMTLGAIAFPIHYVVLRDRDPGELWDDLQSRWLLILLLLGSVALAVQLALAVGAEGYGALVPASVGVPAGVGDGLPPAAASALSLSAGEVDALRDAVFQFVSALSCTGFQSSPIGDWPAGGKLIVSMAMVLGGAAGSTVGGIKIIRGYTISKGIQWQFRRVFLPDTAVVTASFDDRTLGRDEMEREFSEAAIVSFLWVVLLVLSSLVLVNVVGEPFGYADVLFEVASAQGNVGLSTGITGPWMPAVAEFMFIFNMWIGRLEIIPILVFARSILYGLNP